MNGILLIDKPSGWTSFDVVAKIRGIIRKHTVQMHEERGFCMEMQRKDVASSGMNRTDSYDERAAQPTDVTKRPKSMTIASSADNQHARCKCRVKVGHTGTLDPLATGLLVIVVGNYTKRVPELSKVDKTYEVAMKLGETSTTGDEEGIKTKSDKQKPVSDDELHRVLEHFVGEIEQVPPAYSAIKVNGKRAYDLARAGKEVKLEPRKVTIYEITDVTYEHPFVTFTTKVSSGTYIRTLVEDIGKELGTGAYMSDLRRTSVGNFSLDNSQPITEVDITKMLTI